MELDPSIKAVTMLRDAATVLRSWCKSIRRADPKADTSNLNFLDDRAIQYEATAHRVMESLSGRLPAYRKPTHDGLWWAYDSDGAAIVVNVKGHWCYFIDETAGTPARLGWAIGKYTRWVEATPQAMPPEMLEVRMFCGAAVASFGLHEHENTGDDKDCGLKAAHAVIKKELATYTK